jgi:hypothetical protein
MRLLAFALFVLAASPAASLAAPHADAGAETGTGFLDVSSDPPAKILIDDADTGKVTPQPHLELKVGHHKLTLARIDGGHDRTFGFQIESGQTRKFTVHLAP